MTEYANQVLLMCCGDNNEDYYVCVYSFVINLTTLVAAQTVLRQWRNH